MADTSDSCLSLEGEEQVPLTPLEYSKILDIQHTIFELLTVGYNEKEVLSTLCQMAENLLPNSVASVMILDNSTGLMNVICAPSIPQVGHDALQGLKPGPGGGSCGNAVFRNEAQYVKDTKSDKRWTDIRQIAYDFNLCSCWSMPIRNADKQAVGSFALSSFEHRSPSGFHKRLLENCAFIVNIVLKRSQYEQELKTNQTKLTLLGKAMKNASDGIIITDRENNIIHVNDAFLTAFGYESKQDVFGKNPRILSSGKHDQLFYQNMWTSIQNENHWNGEIWNKRTNGEIFPEWMSVSTVEDDTGELQNYLAVFTDLTELHNTQDKLINLAFYDQLTGLPNRQKISADMSEKIPKACAISNIDDFKEINDFFGIAAGDDILRQVGQWFREIDCSPYRIGGDEFAILIYDDFPFETMYTRISSILSLLEEKIFTIGDERINLRMTIGIAVGENDLLTRADIALHAAKEKKTPISVYEEEENVEEKYRHNIAMATSIRQALAEKRIICHYQPIVNVATATIAKYETLVRMIDRDGNIVPPLEFLSIAKKTKIYPKITREVIHQACSLFATRSEEFSINLSDSDIRDTHTVSEIIKTITQTGTASRIVFELLESEGIENYEEVAQFITQVKALGAKIAIDDFGTGYSNFENILKLNVDYIKIDGSLIRGITTNSRHNIIVDTIVDFAKKIGAKTIAEFVSDEAIYDAVITHGIDYSQGYYTGKPEPLN
jgi:PAS domain S-box-containing protein/diguanylate cyclase (GGDEF)-like protein